ncbi:MAG: hypothetical protein KC584_06300, partial [Nitrospira sp.]|nr:hypothetical protein [Nitrospira sp.]
MSEQDFPLPSSPESRPPVPFGKSLSADTASRLKAALKRPAMNVVKDEALLDDPLARVKHAD